MKVDDHTVDVVLKTPNPILNYQWDTWYIMDKEWAEANDATAPTPASATTPSYAALNANGTGPFRIESHQPGVRTVFKDEPRLVGQAASTTSTEIVFTPIGTDATRVAALLSGEVDVIEPVPIQDIAARQRQPERAGAHGAGGAHHLPRLRPDPRRAAVLERQGQEPVQGRPGARGLLQGDRHRDDQDPRHARPLDALAPDDRARALRRCSKEFQRPKFDPEAAKKLLAEAGYPNGFEVGMDCPNDRYVNDEAICQAVVGMLARVGVKVNLMAQPKAQYFAKVLKSGGYNTSFYLLGWTPGTFDSHNVLFDIQGCRDDPQVEPGRVRTSAATATRSSTR